jgi:NTP pyrophosphatase (non-canonical NTP hydrolase)
VSVEVGELQRWMEERYGERDRTRGVERTFAWFVEEVGELSRAVRKGSRAELEHEFSDCLAWLVSLANLTGVDLEQAMERYAQGCPKCATSPCSCPV